MSAVAINSVGKRTFLEPTGTCKLLAICEDNDSYTRATEVCDRLATRFGEEFGIEFAVWKFDELLESEPALEALEAALQADIVLFATHGQMPRGVRSWFESYIHRRGLHVGALVLLLAEPLDPTAPFLGLLSLFEYAAVRSKMDFLPLLPSPITEILAEPEQASLVVRSPDRLGGRPASHWGLNE